MRDKARLTATISVLLMVALMAVMCVTLWPGASASPINPKEAGPPITMMADIAPAGALADFEISQVLALSTEAGTTGAGTIATMDLPIETQRQGQGTSQRYMLTITLAFAIAGFLVFRWKRVRTAMIIIYMECGHRLTGDQLKFPLATL
jgi:hypothetical protein